jgi:hypothetical protein
LLSLPLSLTLREKHGLRGLRGVFLTERKKDGKNYVRRSFMICTSLKYDYVCRINKQKMGRDMQHSSYVCMYIYIYIYI